MATIWGIGFTVGFLLIFVTCERISCRLRQGRHHEHLEQFNERITDTPTPQSLHLTHPDPIIVAVRNPKSMFALEKVLGEVDADRQEIVSITCKVLPPLTPGITPEELRLDDNDREVLTRVVSVAEEAGKAVHPLVIPTNNPMYAIATAARDLEASEVVMGTSEKTSSEVQLEQFAIAWGMASAQSGSSRAPSVRIIGPREEVKYDLQ